MVEKLIGNLVPPSDERGVSRWRWFMFGTVTLLLVWACWATGVFASLGFPGFARADEFNKVVGEVSEVRASLLADKIDDITAQLCMEQFDRQLIEYRRTLQDEFHAVKGRFHESPPCEILLKLKR